MAAAAWITARGFRPQQPKWFVEIVLDAVGDDGATQLKLEVYAEEWGFQFNRQGRTSWIRITDVPFVHGRDDHALLASVPQLRRFSTLLRALERDHGIEFDRKRAAIRTNLDGINDSIRLWLGSL